MKFIDGSPVTDEYAPVLRLISEVAEAPCAECEFDAGSFECKSCTR
jgi:hypothetical protein